MLQTKVGEDFSRSDFLAAIVDSWDGLIYVGTSDYRIRFLNRRFIDRLGRDATGEYCFRALHDRDAPCPWCPEEVFQGQSVRLRFQQPTDGCWFEVLNTPLPLAGGSFAKIAYITEVAETAPVVKEVPIFKLLVDRLSDAIFFHDPEDSRLLYVNDMACQNLGYRREELLGRRIWEYSNEVASLRDWQEIVRRIDAEGFVMVETRHVDRAGHAKEVEIRATVVQTGLQRYIASVARDITERKKVQARLIEEKIKIEAVMAAIGDGITVQDRDFRILYQNEVQIGKQGQHLGEQCFRAYQKRDEVCDGCQVAESFADGRMHRRQTVARTAQGDLHLEVTACPLADAAGNVVACVEVVRDITERLRLEQSREEVFSVISHEMRTPLTAILGFTEYMLENETDTEKCEFLQLIDKEGERMWHLIDNLLSLQRLMAGLGLEDPVPLSLPPLLREITESFHTPLVRQRIEIDCPGDLPAVLGDAGSIRQAVRNLLGNAIKYSPTSSTIVLGVRADGDRALLWVRDEGPGIPAAEQEKIFERFYRAGGGKGAPGTGLGLTLVREIARAHGGRVWVEGAPGEGSTFYMTLPFVG